MKIQVFAGIDGVTFEECYEGKVDLDISGVKVPFISFDELLRNKESSQR